VTYGGDSNAYGQGDDPMGGKEVSVV